MGTRLYVGNLSYSVTSQSLETLFGEYGRVKSAQVVQDRDTGRSKGFGFVEMGDGSEAQAAIQALNLKEVDGRVIGDGKPGPITRKLQGIFQDAVHGKLPQYRSWLSPIGAD